MSRLDEIRNSAEGRSLALARSVAAAFAGHGWRVRQGTAHATGVADVAASREIERRDLETRVHVVVRCAEGARVLFSEGAREVGDVIASYAFDDDLAPPPPAAPPARNHASAFRGDSAFGDVIEDAFLSIDDVLDELHAHDLSVVSDDVGAGAEESEALAPLARRRDLVHAVVVTDAMLWMFGERLTRAPWVRLHRARVVGAEERWVDVVSADALEKYVAAVTRYYIKSNPARHATGS